MNAPAKGFIPAPGHYADLDIKTYHSCDGVSKTGVMKLRRSPAHFKATDSEKDPTPALVMGSLGHTMILEPHKLHDEYIVAPEISRRSNSGKDAWAKFQQEAGDRQIISAEQLEQVKLIQSAVRAHPFAGPALSGGHSEQSYFWHDPLTGVLCKCRPDYVKTTRSGDWLLDLKTAEDASPEAFAKACANFGYHISAAMSLDGYAHVTGRLPLAYLFVVVEKSAPYGIAVYQLEQSAIEHGRDQYQDALCLYRECESTGEWGCYPVKTQTIDLPKWAYK